MYSDELKLKLVKEYFEGGLGIKALAQKYCMDRSSLRKWIHLYNENGEAGLYTRPGTYSGDFKVSVVEYMHSTGASQQQTAAHFNIPSPRTVLMWERKYDEEGKEALYKENRGRASKMGTKRLGKTKNDMNTNEDLLAEVQRFRMENEYLKKLNALVQEREKSRTLWLSPDYYGAPQPWLQD